MVTVWQHWHRENTFNTLNNIRGNNSPIADTCHTTPVDGFWSGRFCLRMASISPMFLNTQFNWHGQISNDWLECLPAWTDTQEYGNVDTFGWCSPTNWPTSMFAYSHRIEMCQSVDRDPGRAFFPFPSSMMSSVFEIFSKQMRAFDMLAVWIWADLHWMTNGVPMLTTS